MKTLLRTLIFTKLISLLLACSAVDTQSSAATAKQDTTPNNGKRPNFVWLVSEDNSSHYLNHFFKGGAKAPAIEALASEGITYTNAYSNAPVCSVARTTLQTGIYAPRMRTQYHRGYHPVDLPKDIQLIHEQLKQAGYYVVNNSKTDYNLTVKPNKSWHESSKKASWRNRNNPQQPFFYMQSLHTSHEGKLHFNNKFFQKHKQQMDLSTVELPPYLPDTELARFTHKYYQELMNRIDDKVAGVVKQLEQDGELHNTFIFYFGDHGGVLPRSKGYLFDSGTRVPLVVRVPENFKHLVDWSNGDVVTGTVQFVDFAPTLLKLAGLATPSYLDGKAFLGKGVSKQEVDNRSISLGYADRFDEKYDLVRAVKQGRFQYIRNYQPYLPNGLFNRYRYRMMAYRQWQELYQQGKLNAEQSAFFQAKPVEMLFDTDSDPHQVNNLAGQPEYQSKLLAMRKLLTSKLKALPDAGFLLESDITAADKRSPIEAVKNQQQQINKLIDIANYQLLSANQALPLISDALKSPNPVEQYWAMNAALAFQQVPKALVQQVRPLLNSTDTSVQLAALTLLAQFNDEDPQPAFTQMVNTSTDHVFVTEVLNMVTYFHHNSDFKAQKSVLAPIAKGKGIEARMDLLAHKKINKK